MKKFILILFVVAMLVSCGPPKSSSIRLGDETLAPIGWTEYCIAHPGDPMCGQ